MTVTCKHCKKPFDIPDSIVYTYIGILNGKKRSEKKAASSRLNGAKRAKKEPPKPPEPKPSPSSLRNSQHLKPKSPKSKTEIAKEHKAKERDFDINL